MEVSQGKSTINAGYSIAMSDLMVDIHGYSPFQAKKRFGTFFQIMRPYHGPDDDHDDDDDDDDDGDDDDEEEEDDDNNGSSSSDYDY